MAAESEKELILLKKRFIELAEKSYRQNVYCFTGFLNMAELDLFYRSAAGFSHVPYMLYGGYEGCERQMVRFGSSEAFGYDEPFPVVCVQIRPLQEKFADDLTHRDFLGACMNLGIDRSTLGDIVINGRTAYLYCAESIAPFVMENMTRVRHTAVMCTLYEGEVAIPAGHAETKTYQVASERLDGVVAKVHNLSRGQCLLLFQEKKVYVNGKIQENNSSLLKCGDAVTLRGFGRFTYEGVSYITKKGKKTVTCTVIV